MSRIPAIIVAFCTIFMASCSTPGSTKSVEGIVLYGQEPVGGAVVRVQGSQIFTSTDTQGRFEIVIPDLIQSAKLTAWSEGYLNGVSGEAVKAGQKKISITLRKHPDADHDDYHFISGFNQPDSSENCEICHSDSDEKLTFYPSLPFDEWILDAHSVSARNPRFLTMYTGSDILGNRSPLTSFGSNRDYGKFPLKPDLNQPYYGPGYQLDFQDSAGNCAACHIPIPAINNPYGIDPVNVTGVDLEGINCDFCHKIWNVRLDQKSGLPFQNMPGVLSYEFLRPSSTHQLFAGPYDDVAPGEDVYNALYNKSQYCAPCHYGVFWDTVIYNSFGEWLQSPYSNPETGQSCQDCHMPDIGAEFMALPEKGGINRASGIINSHLMPGASSIEFLQNAISMTVTTEIDDRLSVNVTVRNSAAGHHYPTDSPLRHLILSVDARDLNSDQLVLLKGPTVPQWGGVPPQDVDLQTSRIGSRYYAGMPGTAYAKILEELWTLTSPSGAYWNPTRVISDNRLPAFGSDTTMYEFDLPSSDDLTVDVTLIYRRAFIALMDQKSWDVPDIILSQQHLVITQ